MAVWKHFNKADVISAKDDCFHDLIEECGHLKPGSRLTYTLRNKLEKLSADCRRDIVNRTKANCAPLFIACKAGQLEIVEYLVRVCQADIEQKGVYEVPEYDKSTHVVSPLWCAAVSGRLPIVKYLLQQGAAINTISDTGSTPVRSACFMSHLDIVQYLVENGADINRANFNGGTCLINSVQSVELCQFLIKHGAHVNAKDIQNKTALHYAIQEHRLETTKLLLENGADYLAKSKFGDDALQTACLKAAIGIFDFLAKTIPYTQERLANAHELIGSTFLDEYNDTFMAVEHWRTAQLIRERAGLLPKQPVVERRAAFRYQVEFSTMAELDNWTDVDFIRIQSILIAERILGPSHKDAVFRLMFRGASYADVMRYQRCIDLWQRALEIRMEKDTILYPDTCFTAQALVRLMVDYNDPSIDEEFSSTQRFADSVKTFKILTRDIATSRELLKIRPQHKRQVESYDRILNSITHLIYLMLRTATTEAQHSEVKQLVSDLVRVNPRSGNTDDSLLHLCVTKQNTIKSGYFTDDEPIAIFPNKSVVEFLLRCGANVNARNEAKSTPLHIATIPYNYNKWLVRLLLSYGAHLDQPNVAGEYPIQKVNQSPFALDLRLLDFITLKCHCAAVIYKHRIPYKGQVPKTLESFIQLHEA